MVWQMRSANVGRSMSDLMKPLHLPARNVCSIACWTALGGFFRSSTSSGLALGAS